MAQYKATDETREPLIIPDALADLIAAPGPHQDSGAGWNGERIAKGARDSTLFYMMCRWRDQGMGWEEMTLAGIGFDQRYCDPPLGWGTIKAKASSALQRPPRGSDSEPSEWPRMITLDQAAAMGAALPPRRRLLGPLQTGCVAWLYGPTGHGKSFHMIGSLNAMSRGIEMGPWEAGAAPAVVGYLDAEMHLHDMLERLLLFPEWGDVRLLHWSQFPAQLNISNPKHQDLIFEWAADLDALALDNWQALVRPMMEGETMWSQSIWNRCARMVSWFRDNGKLLIIGDHAARLGHQQGDTTKQWNSDVAILLDGGKDAGSGTQLQFTTDIKKGRQKFTSKTVDWSMAVTDQGAVFSGGAVVGRDQQIQHLWDQGYERAEIADELVQEFPDISDRIVKRVLVGQKPNEFHMLNRAEQKAERDRAGKPTARRK